MNIAANPQASAYHHVEPTTISYSFSSILCCFHVFEVHSGRSNEWLCVLLVCVHDSPTSPKPLRQACLSTFTNGNIIVEAMAQDTKENCKRWSEQLDLEWSNLLVLVSRSDTSSAEDMVVDAAAAAI